MTPTVGRIWNQGVMSSIRQDWATPTALFKMLDREFHFALDVCATPETTTCPSFFTKGENALTKDWDTVSIGRPVWCNPPYGRGLGDWVEKCYRESCVTNSTVVMLLPARTDTQWFHEYCLKKGEIRFLRGRLNFDDLRPSRAPFPSMIVIFKGEKTSG